MPSRTAYLEYLAEKGMSEAEVLPALPPLMKAAVENLGPELLHQLLSSLSGTPILDRDGAVEKGRKLAQGNSNDFLLGLDTDFRAQLAEAGIIVDTNHYVGVFPTDRLNACAVPREGGALVLVDTGCIEFLEAVCTLAVCAQVDKEPQSKKNRHRYAGVLGDWVADYCENRAYPRNEGPRSPKKGLWPNLWELEQVPSENWHRYLNHRLTTTTEEFVLAHEYGHCIRHFGETSAVLQMLNDDDVVIPAFNRSQLQEFEADIWAACAIYDRCTRVAPGDDVALAIALAGPMVFMNLAVLIEMYRRKKKPTARSLVDTHPPAGERLWVIEGVFRALGGDEEFWIGGNFSSLAEQASHYLFGESLEVPVFDTRLGSIVKQELFSLGRDFQTQWWMG